MFEQFAKALHGFTSTVSDGSIDEKELVDISLEYSAEDILEATSHFSKNNRLGTGAAGVVYSGKLRSGTEVAVKVLVDTKGILGFEDEVRVLSRFVHPNLVTLFGWGQHATNKNEKYLIYELCPGGDVSGRLEKCREGQRPFTWRERLLVSFDAASGLSHMVNSVPKVFHCDIKPANILLDASGTAKMADFGLARTIRTKTGRQHMSVNQINGTPGYACPAYLSTGHVTEQTEVYSFGMVLMEMILDQRPALVGPEGDLIYPILQIAQPAALGAHARVVHARDTKAGHWPPDVLDHCAELALSCVGMEPTRRPRFENIVDALRQICSTDSSAVAPAGPVPCAAQPRVPGQSPGQQRTALVGDVAAGQSEGSRQRSLPQRSPQQQRAVPVEACASRLPEGPLQTILPQSELCARGHPLAEFACQGDGWTCDDCGRVCAQGDVMYGCRQCDFDRCRFCAATHAPPRAVPGPAAPFGSPVGHAAHEGSRWSGYASHSAGHPVVAAHAESYSVSLRKPLGLMLVEDDAGGNAVGVVVESLVPRGEADMAGTVRPGDRVVVVNGQDMSSCDVDTVLKAIHNVESPVTLTLSRVAPPTPTTPMGLPFAFATCSIVLPKPLGLHLADREDASGRGVLVESLTQYGQAEMSRKVLAGDVVVAVNGRDVSSCDVDELLGLIRDAASPVEVVLSRTMLQKPFGISLEDCDTGGVVVVAMQAGSSAAMSGIVRVGDVLRFVNGHDVSSLDVEAVLAIVEAAPQFVPVVSGLA